MSESAWEGGLGCRRKGANEREIIERLGRRKSLSATPETSILAFIFILPFMPLRCLLSILPKISLSSKLCSCLWLPSPPSPQTPNRTEDLLPCHRPPGGCPEPTTGMGPAQGRSAVSRALCSPPVPPASLVPSRTSQPRPPAVSLSSAFVLAAHARGMEETALKDKRRRHCLN